MPCSRKAALESFSISASSSAKMSSSSMSVAALEACGLEELVLGSLSRAMKEATLACSDMIRYCDDACEVGEKKCLGWERATTSRILGGRQVDAISVLLYAYMAGRSHDVYNSDVIIQPHLHLYLILFMSTDLDNYETDREAHRKGRVGSLRYPRSVDSD